MPRRAQIVALFAGAEGGMRRAREAPEGVDDGEESRKKRSGHHSKGEEAEGGHPGDAEEDQDDGRMHGTYKGVAYDKDKAASRSTGGACEEAEWRGEGPLPVEAERVKGKHVVDSDFNKAKGGRLKELREHGVLVDATVRVGSRSYAVHKAVLAAASSVFEAMFTSGLAESRQDSVSLQETQEESFEVCLDFMYTGQVILTGENAECVLRCADRLALNSLRKACIDWLLSVVSLDNCVRLWRIADQLLIPELGDACFAKAVDNFEVVARGRDFVVHASCKLVSLLLQAQDLAVVQEEDAVDQVFRYVDYDPDARLGSLPALLECARLALLQREGLAQVMLQIEGLHGEEVGLLKRKLGVLRVSLDAEEGGGSGEAEALPAHWGKARDGARSWLFAIGGMNDDEDLSHVLRFDARRSDWTHLSPMPSGTRYALGTVCLGGKIFVAGGCRSPTWNLGTLESLDVQEGTWTQHPDMACGRSDFGMSVIGETIYLAGGSTTRVVEAFAAGRGEWTMIASLPHIIGSCRMCSMDDCLYVAGGFTDSDQILDSLLRCDPREGSWMQLASMKAPRLAAALCASNGCLYAVGGFNHESLHLDLVEVYDVRADRWRSLANMTVPRYDLGATVLSGKLYAVGGCDVDDHSTRVVEEYDVPRDEWRLGAPLPVPAQYHGLCAWA